MGGKGSSAISGSALHERGVRCSNRGSTLDARQCRRKAVPDQPPAAATPIDRCEPSLHPGAPSLSEREQTAPLPSCHVLDQEANQAALRCSEASLGPSRCVAGL